MYCYIHIMENPLSKIIAPTLTVQDLEHSAYASLPYFIFWYELYCWERKRGRGIYNNKKVYEKEK